MNNRKHKCFDENGDLVVTNKEQKAINALKRISKSWPSTIWIFAADNSLNIMKKGECNDYVRDENGIIDQRYVIDNADIPSDGGDW
jgi:hypothetical protein